MSDDLRTRLKAFARDCVLMGDMTPCFAQALSDARDAFEALPDERQKLLVEAFDKAQAAAQFHAEYRR